MSGKSVNLRFFFFYIDQMDNGALTLCLLNLGFRSFRSRAKCSKQQIESSSQISTVANQALECWREN